MVYFNYHFQKSQLPPVAWLVLFVAFALIAWALSI